MSKQDSISAEQIGHVIRLFGDKGVTKQQLAKAIVDGTLPDFLEALSLGTVPTRAEFRKAIGLDRKVITTPVENLSLTSLITASNYSWVNSDITEDRFPMPAGFQLATETKIFKFDRDISSENAIAYMKLEGFRPATIFDLLDFGAKNPELQRKYSIVALGSVCGVDGVYLVSYLYSGDSGRDVKLHWFGSVWNADCRFLAVRN